MAQTYHVPTVTELGSADTLTMFAIINFGTLIESLGVGSTTKHLLDR
jgi:hypothetical protein